MANIINHKTMDLTPSQGGFTFVELAIVLVIVGILAWLGAKLIDPLIKKGKYNESKDIVESAVESLINNSVSPNHLPVTGDFPSTVPNPNDALLKPLYYVVDSDLTDTSLGGICGRRTTNITVTVCPDLTCASPTSTISNVAFLVLSVNGNYNNQTAGTQAISSSTTIKVFERDYDVDNYVTDMDRAEEYDDIVKWVGINELRAKANCSGRALKIISNKLPYTFEDIPYGATIFADGGMPYSSGGEYKWCRQEIASSGLTFTPSTLSSDCSALAEASWGQADELAISGSVTTSGTYHFTFFVRDNYDPLSTDDDIATKTFTITVNPASFDYPGCTNYRVWNDIGKKDYLIDGTCKTTANNTEITTPEFLNTGESIIRYNTSNGNCTTQLGTLNYTGALLADDDLDCCVDFDGDDKACP